MALTQKQKDRRKQSLGGSDIAAIMGHDRFRTGYDVFLEKTLNLEDFESDAAEAGTVVEPGLIDWAARRLGVETRKNQFRVHRSYPFHANLDALIVDRKEAIEAKSSSYNVHEEWGEDGTDEVPERVLYQCQWQCLVVGLERVRVVGLLAPKFGSMRLRLYCVEASETIMKQIAEIGMQWWSAHMIRGERPTATLPNADTYKRVIRVPEKTVPGDPNTWDAYQRAKDTFKDAQNRVEELKAAVIAQLLDAEALDLGDGRTVTYFETVRKPYPVKETRYRTLRVRGERQ